MPERALTSTERYHQRLEAGRCVRCVHSLAADGHSHCQPCLDEMVERVNQGPRWKLTAPEPTPRACVIANNREPATEARFLAVLGDLDESDDVSEADGTGEPGEHLDVQRPRTRAECEGTEVCPWVSCKWHLMLDVDPRTGAIKVNYPGVALEDMPATCALEVIDNAPNGITPAQIGVALNITREGARQLTEAAVAKVAVLGGK